MNEKRHPQMEPDNEADIDQQTKITKAIFAKAGYPFPMGPVIPRPDPQRKPLWPELVMEGLNRPKAAAKVMFATYRNQEAGGGAWKTQRDALTARVVLASRNHWLRLQTQHSPKSLKVSELTLQVLQAWVDSLQGSKHQRTMRDLVQDKLRPNLINSSTAGRKKKDDELLLFAPPDYPRVGCQSKEVTGGLPWSIRYSEKTRQHVRNLLLERAGEWNVLTLLFVKLLHAHMAWLVPQMREIRQSLFYRPLLRHLHWCAEQAGSDAAHPLADTAAGVLQTLHRMNLLVSSGKVNDPQYPKHPNNLDPQADDLPDSLHMNSAMWVNEAVSEVKQIFKWMDEETANETTPDAWTALTPWVDDVANLAWEMASARTDPFALGAMGLVSNDQFKTLQTFTKHMGAWSEITKGVSVRVRQLQYMALTKADTESLNSLPSRFKAAFVTDDASAEVDPKSHIDKVIQEIQTWAQRPAQLRLYYESMSKLLCSYGLDKSQATKRDTQ